MEISLVKKGLRVEVRVAGWFSAMGKGTEKHKLMTKTMSKLYKMCRI